MDKRYIRGVIRMHKAKQEEEKGEPKPCEDCGREFPISQLGPRPGMPLGNRVICHECFGKYRQAVKCHVCGMATREPLHRDHSVDGTEYAHIRCLERN